MGENKGPNFMGWMIGCAIALPVLAFGGCVLVFGLGLGATALVPAALEEIEEGHAAGLHENDPHGLCSECSKARLAVLEEEHSAGLHESAPDDICPKCIEARFAVFPEDD